MLVDSNRDTAPESEEARRQGTIEHRYVGIRVESGHGSW